jgi:hypothetical protein
MPVLSGARYAGPAVIALIAVAMVGCGSAAATGHAGRDDSMPPATTMPAMSGASGTAAGAADGMNAMNGMGPMAGGNGLSAAADGYHMTPAVTSMPAKVPAAYAFTITAPGGARLIRYAADHTKKLHFYAIRSDLTGFQHVHPVLSRSGIWTARLAGLTPGRWRLYATFIPAAGPSAGTEFVLSRAITVPGRYAAAPQPAPAAAVAVDGYTVTIAGDAMPGMAMPLEVTITRHGQPVTTLQPYLGAYAHLTAFHAGDLAFAHLHPEGAVHGNNGGPALTFSASLPEAGPWRLFLQFQTGGRVHTAAFALNA